MKTVEKMKEFTDLKDGEHGDGKGVEIGRRRSVREIESSTEQLHAQKSKNQDEKEEKEEQGNDGLHGAEQGDH